MTLNLLYGMLVNGSVSGYYAKKHTAIRHTDRSLALRSAMFRNVPSSAVARLACYICSAVLNTSFGTDIAALDPNNTYAEPCRDPSASSINYTLTEYLCNHSECRKLSATLDKDIKDRLSVPTWIDTMGACCLQLLREAM